MSWVVLVPLMLQICRLGHAHFSFPLFTYSRVIFSLSITIRYIFSFLLVSNNSMTHVTFTDMFLIMKSYNKYFRVCWVLTWNHLSSGSIFIFIKRIERRKRIVHGRKCIEILKTNGLSLFIYTIGKNTFIFSW